MSIGGVCTITAGGLSPTGLRRGIDSVLLEDLYRGEA